jgi:hypothetical protein
MNLRPEETVSHFREFAMNGIEQLHAFISSGKRAGMAVSLAFQLVEVGDGFAIGHGRPVTRVRYVHASGFSQSRD